MKLVTRLAGSGIIALAVGFGLYLLQLNKSIVLTEPVTVMIEDKSGTEGAVQALWQAGVLPSRWAFVLDGILTGQRKKIKAGTYTFTGAVQISDVMAIVTEQIEQREEVRITLLEGWTNEQMARHLADAELVNYDRFVEVGNTKHSQTILPDKEYPYLIGKPLSVGLQGFLFPDTYRVFKGETEIGIAEKMLDNFDVRFTPQMRTDVASQGRSIYDVVILASIVEKEVATPEDKAIVAGIFWKRLDNNQRLQSDATVNYITHKNDTTPSAADLQVESAYNTYRNDGLPPTPIGNPGLDSLTAAVYPQATDYWYFLTTPEGEVKYSIDYDQHLQTRSLYY